MDFHITVYKPETPPTDAIRNEIADFLFTHLDQYGDPREDILKAMDYAMGKGDKPGGEIFCLREAEGAPVWGAVIINRTGMDGYIPGNILVYIAAHRDVRGRGLGKALMQRVLEDVKGDIALHVEANNPAKKLYEKVGFTNPYLEMRLKR